MSTIPMTSVIILPYQWFFAQGGVGRFTFYFILITFLIVALCYSLYVNIKEFIDILECDEGVTGDIAYTLKDEPQQDESD